jgi:hypothetical protein
MRKSFVIVCLVVLAAAVGACGGGSDDAPPPQAGPIATSPTIPPTSSRPGVTHALPSKTVPTSAAPPTSAGDIGPEFFKTPSGNIGCYVDATDGVRCDIIERSWSPPPKPADCEFDWGNSAGVDRRGSRFLCYSDTVLVGDQTLPYGSRVRRGEFECASATEGVTCTHRPSGHGLFLSRASYRLF